MSDTWTEKLSDYLDDELPQNEREALESHLTTCPECTRTLDELQRVVAAAQALKARPPAEDLWANVASRTVSVVPDASRNVMPFDMAQARPVRQPRRISFTLPQLAAAAVLLAAVSSGLAWQFRTMNAAPQVHDSAAVAIDDSPTAGGAVVPVTMADQEYDAAVSDLEKTLQEGRSVLDPATIAIVEQNLAVINVAIEQARQALEADPANGYLSGYLVQARRKKLDLLRRAAAMTTESTQS